MGCSREPHPAEGSYQEKRRVIQRLKGRMPTTAKRLWQKYVRREQDRINDLLHKKSKEMAERYRGYTLVFEPLSKAGMYGSSTRMNRELSKTDWSKIRLLLSYKTTVLDLRRDLVRNSTRECPKCGSINRVPRGAREIACDYCGLTRDRQRGATLNLYQRMEGLSHSRRVRSDRIEKSLKILMMALPHLTPDSRSVVSGFTLTGEEAREGSDELARSLKLLNPKKDIQSETCLSEPAVAQAGIIRNPDKRLISDSRRVSNRASVAQPVQEG